jgi:hypothetical protein
MSTTRRGYVHLRNTDDDAIIRDGELHYENDEDDSEIKYRDKKNKPPYKSIFLALVLTAIGCVLLVFGTMLLTGYIETEHWDRGYPLVILGLLTLAPGSYITTLAWCTFRGYKGYTYAMIPDYD